MMMIVMTIKMLSGSLRIQKEANPKKSRKNSKDSGMKILG